MDEHGISKLETAIILIAFVVVASIFAFTILSIGSLLTDQVRPAPDPTVQACFSGWNGGQIYVRYPSSDGSRTVPIDPQTAAAAVCGK